MLSAAYIYSLLTVFSHFAEPPSSRSDPIRLLMMQKYWNVLFYVKRVIHWVHKRTSIEQNKCSGIALKYKIESIYRKKKLVCISHVDWKRLHMLFIFHAKWLFPCFHLVISEMPGVPTTRLIPARVQTKKQTAWR